MEEKQNLILTDKKYPRLFRGVEMNIENYNLWKMLLPPHTDLTQFSDKRVDYFNRYGFKVSSMYSEIYSKYNGINSEEYIPASLYYYYITPFLCNLNFMEAYVDKNMYHLLFPDVKQPETIVRRVNRRFYDSKMNMLSEKEAIDLLKDTGTFIIKPSLETGGGSGVRKIRCENLSGKDLLLFIETEYGDNWITQVPLKSHEEMSIFNQSSLNTMRLYTFRPVEGSSYVVLGATLRFGGKGSDVDNACSGGGWMGVDTEGNLTERVFRFADFTPYKTSDFGFKPFRLSKYEEAKELCLNLHSRLPYFDLIGWDIAVDEEGDLILLEFNRTPDCEHIQITHGPMFGVYLDDLMNKVKDFQTDYTVVAERKFAEGRQCFGHYFDFRKI